jgi:hypothetical protein
MATESKDKKKPEPTFLGNVLRALAGPQEPREPNPDQLKDSLEPVAKKGVKDGLTETLMNLFVSPPKKKDDKK